MAKQLTIFVENRPGRLQSIAQNLHQSGIDIRAFTIQDRGDYGLLRLIVNRPNDAYLAMADVGCACALKDVLAVSVPDQPGNFYQLTAALAASGINVLDAYGFVLQPHQTGSAAWRSISRRWRKPRGSSGRRVSRSWKTRNSTGYESCRLMMDN